MKPSPRKIFGMKRLLLISFFNYFVRGEKEKDIENHQVGGGEHGIVIVTRY